MENSCDQELSVECKAVNYTYQVQLDLHSLDILPFQLPLHYLKQPALASTDCKVVSFYGTYGSHRQQDLTLTFANRTYSEMVNRIVNKSSQYFIHIPATTHKASYQIFVPFHFIILPILSLRHCCAGKIPANAMIFLFETRRKSLFQSSGINLVSNCSS